MKKVKLLYSKSSMAKLLKLEHYDFHVLLDEETKKKYGWKKGQQRFRPNEVFEIFKILNPLWSDAYIYSLLNLTDGQYKT